MSKQQQTQDSKQPHKTAPQPVGTMAQETGLLLEPEPLDLLLQRAVYDPGTVTPADAIQLHRTIGNQAMGRLAAGQHIRRPTGASMRTGTAEASLQHILDNKAQVVNRAMGNIRPVIQTRPAGGLVGQPFERVPRTRIQRLPRTQVGPVSGRGGLADARRGLPITIGQNDTLRSLATRLLPLWNSATPFTPEGAEQPVPFTPLNAEDLAKGLLVYNRYYLRVPAMSNWRVGLHFPLPVEVDRQERYTVNPTLISRWAATFEEEWEPLLDQAPAGTTAPSEEAVVGAAQEFLNTTTGAQARGSHLSTRALRNSQEAAPLIAAVFDQLGGDAFATALAFMDNLVIHRLAVIMGQEPGQQIIRQIQEVLRAAPPDLDPDRQASLDRAMRMINGSEVRVQIVANATDDTARHVAVLSLANWCRANLPNRTLLDSYLAQANVSQEEKVQTIGRLAIAVARMEFLLGWMYEGGLGDADAQGWENTGTNQGAFVDTYTDAIQTYGEQGPWCTTFAGYAYAQIGFQFSEDAGAATARSPFWSGYRLRHWSLTGESIGGTELTEAEDRVADEASSGALINNDDWISLRQGLNDAEDAEARGQLVQDFFTARITPQSGDIMIIGGVNNQFQPGSRSHTVLVESYDADNHIVSTVEGNAGNAVRGRQIDLTAQDQVRGIIAVVRLGTEYFGDNAQETEETGAPAAGERVTATQLMASMEEINTRLAQLSYNQGWINSSDPTATVFQWIHGSEAASETGQSMSEQ